CADDEKHQRLGGKRFDKPAGMKLRFAGVEEVEQDIEGEKVEDGADGSDEQHKIANQADIPALGYLQVSFVDIVRGNGDQGQVVEHVVQQDLRGQHRQERQEERGPGHAEHVPKIRTGAHQKILHHVAEGFAPLDDAIVEDLEAGLNENHVGGLTSHVRSAGHGDANIGCVKRRSVVDAVAHETDRVAVVFESHQNAVFLRWRDAREYACLFGVVS